MRSGWRASGATSRRACRPGSSRRMFAEGWRQLASAIAAAACVLGVLSFCGVSSSSALAASAARVPAVSPQRLRVCPKTPKPLRSDLAPVSTTVDRDGPFRDPGAQMVMRTRKGWCTGLMGWLRQGHGRRIASVIVDYTHSAPTYVVEITDGLHTLFKQETASVGDLQKLVVAAEHKLQ
jgi:hypothetical protein